MSISLNSYAIWAKQINYGEWFLPGSKLRRKGTLTPEMKQLILTDPLKVVDGISCPLGLAFDFAEAGYPQVLDAFMDRVIMNLGSNAN